MRINDYLLTSVIEKTSWELWCIEDSWLSLEKEINDNIIFVSDKFLTGKNKWLFINELNNRFFMKKL